MAGGREKSDFMMKRSQNKSTFTAQNYKSRWFVLDKDNLSYFDGTLEVSEFVFYLKATYTLINMH